MAEETYWKAYGNRALVLRRWKTMTRDTIFDAASLTKVLAGTPAIMLLVQRGKVSLDAPVSTYIPEFTSEKGKITVRQLMTHTSGLPGGTSLRNQMAGHGNGHAIGRRHQIGFHAGHDVPLQRHQFLFAGRNCLARSSGLPLNEFCAREIYGPLKMTDTGFLPPESKIPRIAPTQMTDPPRRIDGGKPTASCCAGPVHDPTARFMGGVAGHAGVFTTASDMARFAHMMLNLGELEGARIFEPETVKLMTGHANEPAGRPWLWAGIINSAYSSPRGSKRGRAFSARLVRPHRLYRLRLLDRSFLEDFFHLSLQPRSSLRRNVAAWISLYRTIGTLSAEAVTDFKFDSVQ